MSHSDKTASGKALVLSVQKTDTVRALKTRYAQLTGTSADNIHITFCDAVLNDDDPLHKHGIQARQLSLVSMGPNQPQRWNSTIDAMRMVPRPMVLAAATTSYDDRSITVESSNKPTFPDLRFETIRLSCESHPCTGREKNYGGFILYGWQNEQGDVLDDWRLNNKHCKSAYLVVQWTASPDVQRCKRQGAPGQVHGAIYWNVFGIGSDVYRAVGEGFALMNGVYKWNSITFNKNKDAYHDNQRVISPLAKKCVQNILDDWQSTSQLGKTYYVKDLLAED